jgi:hypothetical protein
MISDILAASELGMIGRLDRETPLEFFISPPRFEPRELGPALIVPAEALVLA